MASYESGPSGETGEVNGDLGLYVIGSTHGDLNFGYIGRLLASEFVQPFLAPPAVFMFPSIAIPPLFLPLYPESICFGDCSDAAAPVTLIDNHSALRPFQLRPQRGVSLFTRKMREKTREDVDEQVFLHLSLLLTVTEGFFSAIFTEFHPFETVEWRSFEDGTPFFTRLRAPRRAAPTPTCMKVSNAALEEV
ncbi:hypothetical protein M413DRAFT_21973 [Hebeloma cylindrosporum]|uniref:Uncharacterized protein n=1 Tax=Hebeloma cylindrosporum TaxID=76867 RepID=A0A0C3D091_HEBCY|nr:hypothetical protein M413DRAFT_21973 [Hebeloma cylindrosporum h7]